MTSESAHVTPSDAQSRPVAPRGGEAPAQPTAQNVADPALVMGVDQPLASVARAGQRVSSLAWLQRRAGNQAVQRLITSANTIQRQPPSGYPGATLPGQAQGQAVADHVNKALTDDIGPLNDDQKFDYIRTLNTTPQGGAGTNRLLTLWNSFGARLGQVASDHMPEWEATSKHAPLETLLEVTKAQTAFTDAVRNIALSNLLQNETYVRNHMKELGLAPGDSASATTEAQTQYRRAVQGIAYSVWTIRQGQKKLKQKPVGVQKRPPSAPTFEPDKTGSQVLFDPKKPPDLGNHLYEDYGIWPEVKKAWDQAEKDVAENAGEYLEVYEAVAQNNDDALLGLSRAMPESKSDPTGSSEHASQGQGFESQTKKLMDSLLQRIEKVRSSIGPADVLDMEPIHQRLYSAQGPWAAGLNQWAAKRLVERHKQPGPLSEMGDAALVVSAFASGGFTVFLAAVGVGLHAMQAASDYAQAGKLDLMARATPLKGTELATKAQGDEKRAQAQAEVVKAIVEAILAATTTVALRAAGEAAMLKLLEQKIPDAALRASLVAKVADRELLLRLLSKAESPQELNLLLEAVADAKRAGQLLDMRLSVRARLAALRGDAEAAKNLPDFSQRAQDVEQLLSDPARAEAASAKLGELEQAAQNWAKLDPALQSDPWYKAAWKVAKDLLDAAAKEAEAVTQALQEVASAVKGQLAGLDKRLKSQQSLARKLADRAKARIRGGATPDIEAAVQAQAKDTKVTNDVLRYTIVVNHEQYAAAVRGAKGGMSGRGFTLVREWNAWEKGSGMYKGVNTTWKTPTNQLFEVQVHTAESYAAKEEVHALYDEWRALGTAAERRKEVEALMKQRWGRVPTPEEMAE